MESNLEMAASVPRSATHTTEEGERGGESATSMESVQILAVWDFN